MKAFCDWGVAGAGVFGEELKSLRASRAAAEPRRDELGDEGVGAADEKRDRWEVIASVFVF